MRAPPLVKRAISASAMEAGGLEVERMPAAGKRTGQNEERSCGDHTEAAPQFQRVKLT